ncbi:hypothetical protein QTI95_14065 [Clostridium perfringens]|nr:hypothetical protein [Clostridium perfringens]
MTLDEMITRLSIIANIKARKKQDKEANETLQLMNWLIELKKEEQEKIRLLENIIIKKDVEIRDLSRKLAKWEVPGIER